MKLSRMFETIFTGVSLLTFAIASVLFLHWEIIQNDIPLVEKSARVINVPRTENGIPAFYPGETMIVERDQCAIGDQPVAVYRYFEDHLIHTLQLTNSTSFTGCGKHQFAIDIPKSLPLGPYTYNVTIEFRVNPLKSSVKVPLTPIHLTVLEPPK